MVSAAYFLRLMRLHGLNSRVRPKRRCSAKLNVTDQTKEPLVNLLNRDFSSTSPMKKLVTDMTFIPVVEGWLVLSTVKDLFNQKSLHGKLLHLQHFNWH